MRNLLLTLMILFAISSSAQIGEHRNDLSVGFNAGYVMSNVKFTPKVTQSMHGGITGGITVRYVCEKYFNTICAIQGEINYAQLGWKEKIQDATDQPVINSTTGLAESYSRTINYVQIPVFAHLGWGRENKGAQFFVQAGPQLGVYISDKSKSNFTVANANINDRSNQTIAQDTMDIENKFDYGIAAGLGMEYSIPNAGHIMLEARYYYGLGNLYGDSKKDYFGSSNFGNISIKLTYLFDIVKTKTNKKIK